MILYWEIGAKMNLEVNKIDEETNFTEGDFVVYPAHGVGHVLGIEKTEIGDAYQGGASCSFHSHIV